LAFKCKTGMHLLLKYEPTWVHKGVLIVPKGYKIYIRYGFYLPYLRGSFGKKIIPKIDAENYWHFLPNIILIIF
jgi:hypothetical protein